MRWLAIVRQITALLSQTYLVLVVCLICMAAIPVTMQWMPTVVMTGSMMPNVKPGDVLVAQPITTEELRKTVLKGQVLLATDPAHPGTQVTHRVNVVKLDGTGLLMKGDANERSDSTPMPYENVHGIERLTVPMIGLPVQGIRTGNYLPAGVFLALTIFAQIMVLREKKIQRSTNPDDTSVDLDPDSTGTSQSARRRGRRRAHTPRPRLSASALLLFVAVTASLGMVSSASEAALTGSASNAGNSFSVNSSPAP